MAGNPHVLSVGVDLAPALASNGVPSEPVIDSIFRECLHRHGEARVRRRLSRCSTRWRRYSTSPGSVTRSRSRRASSVRAATAARAPERCEGARPSRAREIADVREEILGARREGLKCDHHAAGIRAHALPRE